MGRLSRRKVVAGLGAIPLSASGKDKMAAEADPVLVLCARYGELERRLEQLMRQWGDYEAWLGAHCNWYKLSRSEQRALPEARKLYAIDDAIERCIKESAQLLRRLRSVTALTPAGAAAKLSVIAIAIDPSDYPSAYRLLLSTIADLNVLSRKAR